MGVRVLMCALTFPAMLFEHINILTGHQLRQHRMTESGRTQFLKHTKSMQLFMPQH
jgi:hypothetical protein